MAVESVYDGGPHSYLVDRFDYVRANVLVGRRHGDQGAGEACGWPPALPYGGLIHFHGFFAFFIRGPVLGQAEASAWRGRPGR